MEVQSGLRPIVGLAQLLPKDVLEKIVVEAIYKHRHLGNIAERHYSESRRCAGSETMQEVRTTYIRAMIELHTQQALLSTLLEVLGYLPEVPV